MRERRLADGDSARTTSGDGAVGTRALPSLRGAVGASLALGLSLAGCGGNAPCTARSVDKGPWVLRATGDGAAVLWESTLAPGCVELAVAPEGPDGGAAGPERIVAGQARMTTVTSSFGVAEGVKQPDRAGTYWVNEVDVGGLDAGRCYRYRLHPDGGDDLAGRFCTARAPLPVGDSFRFMAIGDTNPILGHTVPVLTHVLPERPEFVIHMGDLQYYSSSETWAYWFGAMAPMLRVGALLPAVGNHENETQQESTEFADYSDRLFRQPSPDTSGLGDGNDGSSYYRFGWGGVWFHAIDTEVPYDSGSPQYQWLTKSLVEVSQTPGFRFSVVYMHRNLYTLGDSSPQLDRRMELAPQFESYKVRLVLSGHMHGYERFEVGDITYVTTAGGGANIGDVNKGVPMYPADAPLRVVGLPAYHAMIFDVTPTSSDGSATTLHGRAIDEHGQVIDEFTHVIP